MGLFSDICPDCGNKVSKRARFCSKCGRGAPDGWFKCPQCGQWVGNDSKFCPHCNHPLFPEERIDLAGGVWARKPGEFARRFELDDVRFIKENGLMVQEGTIALLLDGGKVAKELGPGRHSPISTLRSVNWFGNPPPRAAVMVDAGECIFRVDFTGKNSGVGEVQSAPLRSAEELEVGCVAEITLRYVSGRGDRFVANVLKEARSLSSGDVCALVYEHAATAVRDLCAQSRVEDLVKDPERRERFEDAITRALRDSMKEWGLEIVRTGAVDFYGPAYEEVRAKYGELEKSRRLFEFRKAEIEVFAAAADEEAAAGKRDAKRDQEAKEYLEQLAQEKQLSEIERTQELAIAARVSNGEISAEEAKLAAARELEEHAKNMTALAHKLELDLTLRNYDREQLVKDAENKARLGAIARDERLGEARLANTIKREDDEAEIDSTSKWLDIAAKRDSVELERRQREAQVKNADLRERAEILAGKSELELAALAEGDAQARKAFLDQELAKQKMVIESQMTPEQLLARNAGASAEAAQALARMAEAKENAASQVLDERRKMDAERLRHDELTEKQLFELAGKAVERQTTVVPPAPVTNIQH